MRSGRAARDAETTRTRSAPSFPAKKKRRFTCTAEVIDLRAHADEHINEGPADFDAALPARSVDAARDSLRRRSRSAGPSTSSEVTGRKPTCHDERPLPPIPRTVADRLGQLMDAELERPQHQAARALA